MTWQRIGMPPGYTADHSTWETTMVLRQQEHRPHTAKDLEQLPDDGNRYEIIRGELIVSPSPSFDHQLISKRLVRELERFIDEKYLGIVLYAPIDVHLGDHDVLQPDIVFVLRKHRDRIKPDGVHGPLDLVIEIISPSTAGIDRVTKQATYAAFGVSEYWIADPERETVLVQVLRGSHYEPLESDQGLVGSELVGGLSFDPGEIFQPVPWLS